jgi:hypothetical protein
MRIKDRPINALVLVGATLVLLAVFSFVGGLLFDVPALRRLGALIALLNFGLMCIPLLGAVCYLSLQKLRGASKNEQASRDDRSDS